MITLTQQGWLLMPTYGTALIIAKPIVQAAYTIFCLITPATNWTIPFVVPRLKRIIWRYE